MDGRDVLKRLPLAQAVLGVWGSCASDEVLDGVFDGARGRSYEGTLTFPELVRLFSDAIVGHGGSGRQSIVRAIEQDQIGVSVQAAYGKLRRVPVAVSQMLVGRVTQGMDDLFPARSATGLPASLGDFHGVVVDGKTIKDLDHRLKATRTVKGGLLAGRALAGMRMDTGVVVAMRADQDAYAAETSMLPELVEDILPRVPGPRLWIADRQFGYLTHIQTLMRDPDDAFILRYRVDVPFVADPARATRRGRDAQGRCWREQWGVVRVEHPQPRACPVRLVTLQRPGQENVVVMTNLLDGRKHPAADILGAYLGRWGIERVFQQITEVFGLEHLIGSSPCAAVFQFALCVLWYNTIQLVKAHVAPGGDISPSEVSGENLFVDVHRQLVAVTELLTPRSLARLIARSASPAGLRQRLTRLLRPTWTTRWTRSPPKPPSKARPRTSGRRDHASAYRIIQRHKQRRRPKRR